jgi:NitT/TauT family transport system permease protein
MEKAQILVKEAKQGVFPLERWLRRHGTFWTLPFLLTATMLAWELITRYAGLPAFILPAPEAVGRRFLQTIADGSLLRHTMVTLHEVVLGLLLGLALAVILGYGLAKSRLLERLLAPYIVASQSIPVVAIAPLLVIWFGPGRISKIFISMLIVFFPVLVNTVVGLRSVPEDLRDLMKSLRATRLQVFMKLEVPAALPVLLGGLKIGATLSVIGAVVGEFVGADEGLGFLINVGRGIYDTALVFLSVIVLIGMALSLFGVVVFLERRFTKWQENAKPF